MSGRGSAAIAPQTYLGGRVKRKLWRDVAVAATAGSALMAVVAGLLVLSRSAAQLERQADGLQRQLSVALTSYEPLFNLQRLLQQAAASREVESAVVIDQRGLVLAASDNALVDLPLPQLLQLPAQQHLRQLFGGCPSTSTLLTCLNREAMVFRGPVPWIGGDVLISQRSYPLALQAGNRFGDRATLITITDARPVRNQALLFMLQLFLAGLLPLAAACLGLVVRLRQQLIPDLLRLAQTDVLSGIYNRRAFTDAAERMLARAREAGLPLALALIDVDFFKQVNDNHGHDAGDTVIRRVAERLTAAVRTGDLVGRLGGDEFAILVQLPGPAATQMLERTRSGVQATPIGVGGEETVQVNLSVGVASTAGAAGYGLDQLMSAADAALYVAKDRGRGQVVNLEEQPAPTTGGASTGSLGANAPLPSTRRSLGDWQIGGL